MFKVDSDNTIHLTRGDTLRAVVDLFYDDEEETPYVPENGDYIRFALKKYYGDRTPIINKRIQNGDRILYLEPNDTKSLPFGEYVYDIEITHTNGDVDTFIYEARFDLRKEVH